MTPTSYTVVGDSKRSRHFAQQKILLCGKISPNRSFLLSQLFGVVMTKAGACFVIFQSILFANGAPRNESVEVAPACFPDLNLDQVVAAITAGTENYNLKPFFHAPLSDLDEIHYRHEIFHELEREVLFSHVNAFSAGMQDVRRHLNQAEKLRHDYQKKGWFLEAVGLYCEVLETFLHDLSQMNLQSRGFSAFRAYLQSYIQSASFEKLHHDAKHLKERFAEVRYCVLINDGGFVVRNYENEPDYSVEIEETFARFKQGASKDYRVKLSGYPEMNHIEEKVLDFVVLLNPEPFFALSGFCERNAGFLDEAIERFDREVQFYLAYLTYLRTFTKAGLKVCYPDVSIQSKSVFSSEGYDQALAQKLIAEKAQVVTNDFELRGAERLFVVTGPNQGGKTTFARTFGQMHYLACLGCPVAGQEARLFLCDAIFTHFEKEENAQNLRSKLEDDLIRIHEILLQATDRSIVIMNEIFTSTALTDAVFLSKEIIGKLIELGALGVFVTFIDELASLSQQTVSMVSMVSPDNPATRTFKIKRKPAEGLAYAMSIAEKHGLTYEHIMERIAP
jgi:DNA mismatch repair ATPase MutS